MVSSREREAWSHIFKLYKGMPHLWDKNHINFGNRGMMTEGYKILTQIYKQQIDKQASVSLLRMKMKNLRTTYYRELRKARQKGKEYVPSLWYFEDLNFLGSSVSKYSSSDPLEKNSTQESSHMDYTIQADNSKLKTIEDLSSDTSDIEIDFGPSSSQPKVNTGKEVPKRGSPFPLVEKEDVNTCQKKVMKDEHWEIIGKAIGYQLRDLNKKQFTIVSKLISDAIFFGRLNKLTEISRIDIGTSIETDSCSQHYIQFVDALSNQPENSLLKKEDDEVDEDS